MRERLFRPSRIRLDACTACQLQCPACPTAGGEIGKHLGSGLLDPDDFVTLLQNNPRVRHVELSNWGELFLNKALPRILEHAYRHGVALYAANGVNLNQARPEALEALVKYRVRKLTCSIDGASEETYARYRVGGNLANVLGNIRTINEFKKRYRSPYPEMIWQFVVFGHNEHEIAKARAMAADLGMRFRAKLSWGDMFTENFSPVRNRQLVRREVGLGVADRTEYRERYRKNFERACCLGLWSDPQINYDGRVLGCSINYWADYGNAFTEGLDRPLNSEAFVYAKRMLMGQAAPREGAPCTTCKVYTDMAAARNWITTTEIKRRNQFLMIHGLAPKSRILGWMLLGVISLVRGARRWLRTVLRLGRKVRRKLSELPAILKAVIKHSRALLQSGVYPVDTPLAPDDVRGWQPYPVFRGKTAGLPMLSCHVSVLNPGHSPHPPHVHQDEEILLVLTGEVDIVLPQADNPGGGDRRRLRPGDMVYYPRYFPHTLETVSEQPANYMMFKWFGLRESRRECLGFEQFELGLRSGDRVEPGFQARTLFEGPSRYLAKLQCHLSTLSPGAGYKPHIDPYDVVLIILDGEVETLGQRVGPFGVVHYAAGTPHGIHNPGDRAARYVVFEFHAL